MKKSSAGKKGAKKCVSVVITLGEYARLARAAKRDKRSISAQVNFFIGRCLYTPSDTQDNSDTSICPEV